MGRRRREREDNERELLFEFERLEPLRRVLRRRCSDLSTLLDDGTASGAYRQRHPRDDRAGLLADFLAERGAPRWLRRFGFDRAARGILNARSTAFTRTLLARGRRTPGTVQRCLERARSRRRQDYDRFCTVALEEVAALRVPREPRPARRLSAALPVFYTRPSVFTRTLRSLWLRLAPPTVRRAIENAPSRYSVFDRLLDKLLRKLSISLLLQLARRRFRLMNPRLVEEALRILLPIVAAFVGLARAPRWGPRELDFALKLQALGKIALDDAGPFLREEAKAWAEFTDGTIDLKCEQAPNTARRWVGGALAGHGPRSVPGRHSQPTLPA